jgi:hypothetical protein
MPYSIEEDHWLTSRLVQTQETLWSVPIGEDVLRELLLFSIGVVPSRFYLLSTCHVFAERIWKVLEMHQGINTFRCVFSFDSKISIFLKDVYPRYVLKDHDFILCYKDLHVLYFMHC